MKGKFTNIFRAQSHQTHWHTFCSAKNGLFSVCSTHCLCYVVPCKYNPIQSNRMGVFKFKVHDVSKCTARKHYTMNQRLHFHSLQLKTTAWLLNIFPMQCLGVELHFIKVIVTRFSHIVLLCQCSPRLQCFFVSL